MKCLKPILSNKTDGRDRRREPKRKLPCNSRPFCCVGMSKGSRAMSEWIKGMQFGSHIIDERLEDGTYLTHCAECGRVHVLSRPALREAKVRNSVCRSCHTADNNRNRATHGLTRAGVEYPKDLRVFRGILRRWYNPKNKD